MPTYRITRVYVLNARTKAAAGKRLNNILRDDPVALRTYGDPSQLLDFESIREVAPDERPQGPYPTAAHRSNEPTARDEA